MIILQTKVVCYSPSYKNFWKDFVVEQNLTHLKGHFWKLSHCLYEILVVWDDQMIGNMDPCYQSNSNLTEKDSFLHNVTRVLVTLRRSPRHLRKQPSNWALRPPHSLDETARLLDSYKKTVTASPTELCLYKNLKTVKHDNSLIQERRSRVSKVRFPHNPILLSCYLVVFSTLSFTLLVLNIKRLLHA